MNKKLCTIATTVLITSIISGAAQASMRCEHGLVDKGDTAAAVLETCGAPSSKQVISPELRSDGHPVDRAVTVENWVYGPDNGNYKYLKFIDGKLVNIDSGR